MRYPISRLTGRREDKEKILEWVTCRSSFRVGSRGPQVRCRGGKLKRAGMLLLMLLLLGPAL